jgi:uncharacterized protein (DUF924 family)
MNISRAQEIVDYWLGLPAKIRFARDAEFDNKLRQLYIQDISRALSGDYEHWLEDATATLAFILLLDQMNRNINRNSAKAFEGDAKALHAAHHAIDCEYDKQFNDEERVWFYMPYMHSERPEDQELSVSLFKGLTDSERYALIHRDVIRRFGRFPHRNRALGRTSTPEEIKFLENGGFSA